MNSIFPILLAIIVEIYLVISGTMKHHDKTTISRNAMKNAHEHNSTVFKQRDTIITNLATSAKALSFESPRMRT